jgi:hypothetical protein
MGGGGGMPEMGVVSARRVAPTGADMGWKGLSDGDIWAVQNE